MDTWLIYQHTNKVNGFSYIGCTKQDTKRRWCNNGGGYIRQPLFYEAIQKYGWENFDHAVLEDNIESLDLAYEREKYWVAYYHTWRGDPECRGYNDTIGGIGSSGHIVSDEARRKIGEANSGRAVSEEYKARLRIEMSGEGNHFYGHKHTEETRQKISAANRGKKISEETKQKISETQKGRIVSEETRKKLSEANKGKKRCKPAYNKGIPMTEEIKRKISETKKQRCSLGKPVICIETGETFRSQAEAANWAGIAACTLNSHLNGRAPSAGKYHWRYGNLDD